MPKKSDKPLEKVTLRLFAGDVDRLRELHSPLDASQVIRELVRGHIRQIEEIAAQGRTKLDLPEVVLPEDLKPEPPKPEPL